MDLFRRTISFVALLFLVFISAYGQGASITEERVVIPTYPFSDPNPITTLVTKPEIYPYHKFDGYSHTAEPKEWKVVTLENEFIKVFILPEVGGKIWGAIEKSTGKDFIYKNEVMKFRNIAMRGPWTSGGIEFNFGIIGHTPSTATPVDYVITKNEDGSVSCTVGTMDLPSRTQWRVTITLEPDKAYFTTKSTWYNPTTLTHPYYNWMTAAAKATEDLTFYIPGEMAIHHSGEPRNWPVEENGKQIWKYKENNFGPNKSYHVLGKYHNFFGGYWQDEGIGFAHLGRQETMPGQKLWLWSLARDGGIWEDLLTDNNGQYAEYQAGRLLNQYFNDEYNNPITEMAFVPHLTDEWEEQWLPIKGTGGITAIAENVVLHVIRSKKKIQFKINALALINNQLQVLVDDEVIHDKSLKMSPMEVVEFELKKEGRVEVKLGGKVVYSEEEEKAKALKRPLTNQTEIELRPAVLSFSQASELSKRRRYTEAKSKLKECLLEEADFFAAHNLLAEIYYRSGLYDSALYHANVVLQFDTYDFDANYFAGLSYQSLGDGYNALDALGFAGRSMKYRSASYTEIARLELSEMQLDKAIKDAAYALSFNAKNVAALQTLLMAQRLTGNQTEFNETCELLLSVDPLHHFARFEKFLNTGRSEDLTLFKAGIFNEFPYQTHLEIASSYVNVGLLKDAITVLKESPSHPVVDLWLAYCNSELGQPFRESLNEVLAAPPEFVFPYRTETLKMLEWANDQADSWKLKYYWALNLWGKGRLEEAGSLLKQCGTEPTVASFYVSRSALLSKNEGLDPSADLKLALGLESTDWRYHHALIKYFQDEGQFEEQLKQAAIATEMFPKNYVVSLDYAQSLADNELYETCLEVLNTVKVLPAEGSFSGRKIYGRASLQWALQYYENEQFAKAKEKLLLSYLYPENLGSGRPFDPDERLIDFLLGQIEYQMGEDPKEYYEKIASYKEESPNTKFQLFNLLAHRNLGDMDSVIKLLKQLKEMQDDSDAKWVLDKWESKEDPILLIKELSE